VDERQQSTRSHQPPPALVRSDGLEVTSVDIPGQSLKQDLGLLEYVYMVRRHKAAVVALAIAGALAGFVATVPSARVYRTAATLEIQGLNPDFLDIGKVNPVNEPNGYYDADIQTQVTILQSRALVGGVHEKLRATPPKEPLHPPNRIGAWRQALNLNPPSQDQLWSLALGMAAGSVSATTSGTNRIVQVSCDSTHPPTAASFCNALVQEYIDQNLKARWQSTEYTGEWLTRQLDDLKIKLEQQQEAMSAYARQTGLVFTEEKTSSEETELSALQDDLASARADRIAKQSRFEMASSSPSTALPDVLDDETLSASRQQLTDLRGRLALLLVTLTPKNAEVRKLQAQITAIEESLEGTRANIMTRIRKEFEAAQRRERLLQTTHDAQARLLSTKAEEIAHYTLLKREVEATRTMYESLLQRLKEASIASALRASNVRIVDLAPVPGAPYQPNVRQRVTMGLLAGLIAGIAFAVFRERANRTLQDPGDITYYLGLPELGVLPVGEVDDWQRSKPALGRRIEPANGNGNGNGSIELISWTQRQSLLAESFRTTLTSILFSRRHEAAPQVLVLTSASPKEGKTTVVSNLSIAVAEIKSRVLVIDADLRRPRQHRLFNVPNQYGLSDLLSEKSALRADQLRNACVATSVPGLALLPSGSSRTNASTLLHSERVAELIALARDQFDAVVIDTPPMANLADARVLAKLADAVVLVIRSGVTTRDSALLAASRLMDDGTPILGTILNFWNPTVPGYGYYKYYYSGYYNYYAGNGQLLDDAERTDDEVVGPEAVAPAHRNGSRRTPGHRRHAHNGNGAAADSDTARAVQAAIGRYLRDHRPDA
jgi:capsular exopolysaccharide synthesis family protein